MGKPGMMFYFDTFHILQTLNDQKLGLLFRAAMEYAEYGTIPECSSDDSLSVSWGLLKAAADRDTESYVRKCLQSEYANYCKQQKVNGEDKLSFADWLVERSFSIPTGAESNRQEPNGTDGSRTVPKYKYNSKYKYKSNYKSEREYAPTQDEVRTYVAQMGYRFDPDKFFNTYNTVGWKKHGDLIVDWKSLADNWEKTETRPESRNKRNSDMQQHGEVSPMMREAARKILEEEGEQYDDAM